MPRRATSRSSTGSSARPGSCGPVRDWLRAAGHEVAYVVLRAPLAVCRERARERATRQSVDADAVERIWRDFADLGELERLAVDTAAQSPDETAASVTALLRGGRLVV